MRVATGILVAVLVLELALAFSPLPKILDHAVNDDTFYYLQWAWNVAEGHGPTFDGLNRTNGVQPLWAVLLVSLAEISADKNQLIHFALGLGALLNFLAGWIIIRACLRWGRAGLAILVAVVYGLFQSKTRISLSAMDIHVSLVFFALFVVWLVDRIREQNSDTATNIRQSVIGGIWIAGLILSRPDNAPYGIAAAIVYLYLFVKARTHIRVSIQRLIVLAGIPTVTLAGYLIYNQIAFQSPMPISGSYKHFYQIRDVLTPMGGYNFEYLAEYVPLSAAKVAISLWRGVMILGKFAGEGLLLFAPFLFFVTGRALGSWKTFREKIAARAPSAKKLLLSGAVIAGVALLWMLLVAKDIDAPIEIVLTGLFALGIGFCSLFAGIVMKPAESDSRYAVVAGLWTMVLSLAFLRLMIFCAVIGFGYAYYGRWYYAADYLIITLTVATTIYYLIFETAKANRMARKNLLVTIAGFAVLVFAWWPVGSVIADTNYEPTSFYNKRRQIAQEVRESTPPDAILAAWNAGELGYFSERRTVNMDGLINGTELLEHYKSGRPTTEYFDRVGITYVMDYQDLPKDQTRPESAMFYSVPRDSMTELKSWLFPDEDLNRLFLFYRYH